MRKVGLKPGGGNKVAPFPTPSEKAGRAVEQLALSVLIGGISLGFGVHVRVRVLVNETASL